MYLHVHEIEILLMSFECNKKYEQIIKTYVKETCQCKSSIE